MTSLHTFLKFFMQSVFRMNKYYADPDPGPGPDFSPFGSGFGRRSGSRIRSRDTRSFKKLFHKSLNKTIFCNYSFFGDYLLSSLDLVLEMFKGIENILKTNLLLIYVFSFFLPVLAFKKNQILPVPTVG